MESVVCAIVGIQCNTMPVKAKMIVASFGAIVYAAPSDDCRKAFKEFMLEYDKSYETAKEEAKRLLIFASNYEAIVFSNRLNNSYTLAVNEFADQTPEEFRATHLGLTLPATGARWSGLPYLGKDSFSGAALPESVDWVSKGAVTGVKNQGNCGSCWAFSTTGSIEGAWQIATNKSVSLSEQQFVDCSTTNNGCNGGSMDEAFKFIEGHALCSEQDYGYEAKAGTCHENSCSAIPQGGVTGYRDVDENSDEALMEALAKQPVSVAIEADKTAFQLYQNGVLTSTKCGTQLDHGVLAVGYGIDNGIKYWKVKNSWGPKWGEDGYIRLERGDGATPKEGGECGILKMSSYPVVASVANIIV